MMKAVYMCGFLLVKYRPTTAEGLIRQGIDKIEEVIDEYTLWKDSTIPFIPHEGMNIYFDNEDLCFQVAETSLLDWNDKTQTLTIPLQDKKFTHESDWDRISEKLITKYGWTT